MPNNIELLSYIIGGSFGLFLCITHIIFYMTLRSKGKDEILSDSKKKASKNNMQDLMYIALVGVGIMLLGIFGVLNICATDVRLQSLFHRLKLVSAILMAIVYVTLLRYFLIYIKDLGFVETDGFKSRSKKYMAIIYSVAGLISILLVFTNLVISKRTSEYQVTGLFIPVFIAGIFIYEFIAFSKNMKKETGKITTFNRIRFRIILWAGLGGVFFGLFEIIFRIFFGNSLFQSMGSVFIYGMIFVSIALNLNIVFEYMELMERMGDSNKKLTDLNKRMMDDVRLAQSLQISLLPIDKQREIQKHMDMEISYMPMQSVGGDYYDFYILDEDRILILLGDASGHGIYAAMIWAMLKVEVEEMIEQNIFEDLAQAFTVLNGRITRILENTYSYATLFSCLINSKENTVTYIAAGHSDQIYYSARTKDTAKIRNQNPIIGTFKNAKYYAETISCQKGDAILLFTDGINEEVNPQNEQLGTDRVEMMFCESCGKFDEASDVLNNMLIEIETYSEGVMQHDDRTIMVVRL